MDKLYKHSFRESPVIQVLTDQKNKIIDVNNRFCKYFGYSRKEAKDKHISFILADNDTSIDDIDKSFILDPSDEYPNVWEVSTKNGNIRFISIKTTPIKDGNSLTISYDLTKEGHRARTNTKNIKELKKYLINLE